MHSPRPVKPKVVTLKQLLQDVASAQRATIVFGAGVSVALAGAKASWTAFLNSLVNSVSDRYTSSYCNGSGTSHWVGAEALEHRLHTIRSLSHGDPDAAVAATYLIDRVHSVHGWRSSSPGAWSPLARNDDINKVSYEVEEEWQKRSGTDATVQRWNKILHRLGDHARAGKVFLITTNFDHCIARATGLPIFLGGWCSPFNRQFPARFYQPRPEGVVIRANRTHDQHAWMDTDIQNSNTMGIAPQVHAQAWRTPGHIPRSWWQDLATVFHVHGSRLASPSIVFDASSYSMLDHGAPILQSSEILRCLLSTPTMSGPVIFVGCKGTLLDPHFIQYWNKTSTTISPVTVLQRAGEIDPLAREMYGHFLVSPPTFCSFGKNHDSLPQALERIVAMI